MENKLIPPTQYCSLYELASWWQWTGDVCQKQRWRDHCSAFQTALSGFHKPSWWNLQITLMWAQHFTVEDRNQYVERQAMVLKVECEGLHTEGAHHEIMQQTVHVLLPKKRPVGPAPKNAFIATWSAGHFPPFIFVLCFVTTAIFVQWLSMATFSKSEVLLMRLHSPTLFWRKTFRGSFFPLPSLYMLPLQIQMEIT